MTGIPAGYRVDWQRVLLDLVAAGFTNAALVQRLGIPRTTLREYRDHGSEPAYSEASRIVVLWCDCKRMTADSLPVVRKTR